MRPLSKDIVIIICYHRGNEGQYEHSKSLFQFVDKPENKCKCQTKHCLRVLERENSREICVYIRRTITHTFSKFYPATN